VIEERKFVTLEADTKCYRCATPLLAGTRVLASWDELNNCWRHKCTKHRKYEREIKVAIFLPAPPKST
jgi:hypothetical protein